MSDAVRRSAMTVAALAALGLGGAAIAGAANTSKPSGTSSSGSQTAPGGPGRPDRRPLSSDVAAKVKAAALEKVPGATVLRAEAGGPYGTPYHAHVKTSDGKLEVVLVDASFDATAVQADQGRGGRGPHGGPGGPGDHRPETALTGDAKRQVEDAVLARYPGATIERTETNTDGGAPYESHVTTKDGTQLEVQVSKDFAVVTANQRPAHP